MKFLTPSHLLFLICLLFSLSGMAQVGITAVDFPRAAGFTDSVYLANAGAFVAPTEGPDQTWDYSGLTAGALNLRDFTDVRTDTNILGAYNSREFDLSFQGFPIASTSYEGLDEEGWFEVGRTITEVAHSITPITGGPNDTLRILGANEIFDGRINKVKFPMAFGDEWEGSETRREAFLLSVAAFGLNRTPGYRQGTSTEERSIVGHGMLTLPTVDGENLQPVRCLLTKVKRSIVDSTFLGGAPAPPALMAAFGLTQGGITTDSFYVFYTPGLGAPFFSWGTLDNTVAFFRVQPGRQPATGTRNQVLGISTVYPNPVASGQQITFRAEQTVTAGEVVLLNALGHQISQTAFAAGLEFKLDVPAHCPAGIYYYQVRNQANGITHAGKLLVD
jgi:hypothetical protein